MQQRTAKRILSTLLLLALNAVAAHQSFAAGDSVKNPIAHVALVELSSIDRGGEAVFQLYDAAKQMLPPGLVGITADPRGSVYLCDGITEQLVKLDPDGSRIFSVGSTGQGPEDHTAYGEPIIVADGLLARTDCAYSGKILLYQASTGTYIKTISLSGTLQYARIWWQAVGGVAIAVETLTDGGGGFNLRSVLVSISHNGQIAKTLDLVNRKISASNGTNEEDWWVVPLLSSDDIGNIYLQPAADSKSVLCLDPDFVEKWQCTGEWESPRRDSATIEEIRRHSGPKVRISPVGRSLRRIVARANDTVWIQPNRLGRTVADNYFIEYGINGIRTRELELEGLPTLPGDYVIHGDLLIWKSDDDMEATGQRLPYLKVFRIPGDK